MTEQSTQRTARQGETGSATGWSYRPATDVLETPDELIVRADMPGATPEGIDVRFEDGLLTLHGRVDARQPSDVGFLRHEYGVGGFDRQIHVTAPIQADRIEAVCADGVLTVRLPKSESAKPRRIPVKSK